MEVVCARCCGPNAQKKSLSARVLISLAGRVPAKETRSFGTMTDDLLALAAWLEAKKVRQVTMESTGVY